MLINYFYTVQSFSYEEQEIKVSILLNNKHEVYKGHFPSQSVVPGVIQIQMVRELTEKALNQKLFINEIISAKYLKVIVPDDKPFMITIFLKPIEEGYSLNGIINNGDVVFSKIKMKTSPQK